MHTKPTHIEGRIWVVKNAAGVMLEDVDTDMIFHNRHLHITELSEMGQHTFGNLPGWEDFSSRCLPGDIVFAGGNFGSGSSRQQAVDCFRSLGITALVAESFGAIYKRNAINSGFAILSLPDLGERSDELNDGDRVRIALDHGQISCGSASFQAEPLSQVQLDIYQAGSLFAFGRSLQD